MQKELSNVNKSNYTTENHNFEFKMRYFCMFLLKTECFALGLTSFHYHFIDLIA